MAGKERQNFQFDPIFQMVLMVALKGLKRVRNLEPTFSRHLREFLVAHNVDPNSKPLIFV